MPQSNPKPANRPGPGRALPYELAESTPRTSRREPRTLSSMCGRWGERLASAEGFTIIETLVATFVLVVALLGSFMLLDATVHASYATRSREGATNLAREITEDARSLPFSQLTNSTVVSQLQALPGLANQAPAGSSAWQIVRRGITYTVSASEADVSQGSVKQVTVTVQYTALRRLRSVQEVTTISSAGVVGLTATNLVLAQPQPGPNNAGTATQPVITSAGVNQLTFSVTAPAAATNIVWTVNGVTQSTTGVASGASTWTWGISGLPDGVYRVGAAAQSATGTVGPTTTIFVKLIRSAPPAPVVTGYGFNPNVYVNNALVSSPVAEVQWSPVPNVAGYRVYSPASSTTPMCQITTPPFATSCIDFNPPGNSNLTYKVVALYTDANNSLLESPNAASVTLTGVQSTTYSFAPTLATGSNCLSGAYDMHASYTPAATDTSTAGSTYITSATFCSDLLSAGQAVPGSFSATAWFTNATNQSCTVNATVNINGGLGLTTTASVPAGNSSTYSQATFNWNWGQNVAISAGSRINVQFSWSSCGTRQKPLTMYWGSAAHAGTYHSLPTLSPPPNTPTALAVTRNASGVATLTWTPPSTGTSVYFYRVYRDGRNYTNRIAWADPVANCTSTQCTLNDPTPDTAQHTYYITAVGGTTPGSNMAESAMTAGVTR